MVNSAPVINDDSSETKKRIVFAISLEVAFLFKGIFELIYSASSISLEKVSLISVSVKPG